MYHVHLIRCRKFTDGWKNLCFDLIRTKCSASCIALDFPASRQTIYALIKASANNHRTVHQNWKSVQEDQAGLIAY